MYRIDCNTYTLLANTSSCPAYSYSPYPSICRHSTLTRVLLFTAEDGHASTPAGLWVLSAFLFFVIFEKIIAAVNEEAPVISEQQTDETSNRDTSKDKEMDNNNCITMMMNTENTRNGFVKGCLKNTIEVIYN